MSIARPVPGWTAEAAFAATLAAGWALLAMGGAPMVWLVVQAAASGLALLLLLPPVRVRIARLSLPLLMLALLALAATLVIDAGAEGVHRWLTVAGVRLHIGLMLVPVVLVIHARGERAWSGLVLIGCAAVVGLQPDFGIALALMLGLAPLALWRRDRQDWLAFAAVTGALALTATMADPLLPVALVEHVLTDSWRHGVIDGLLSLGGALLLPAALLARAAQQQGRERWSAIALAGLWSGLMLASLVGHYPVPLLGYGASGIIGIGLALALTKGK